MIEMTEPPRLTRLEASIQVGGLAQCRHQKMGDIFWVHRAGRHGGGLAALPGCL
jgi:hypothetical protein